MLYLEAMYCSLFGSTFMSCSGSWYWLLKFCADWGQLGLPGQINVPVGEGLSGRRCGICDMHTGITQKWCHHISDTLVFAPNSMVKSRSKSEFCPKIRVSPCNTVNRMLSFLCDIITLQLEAGFPPHTHSKRCSRRVLWSMWSMVSKSTKTFLLLFSR